MLKVATVNYVPTPGESYGEWCWKALTPEWREWIEGASNDWILNEIRRYVGRDWPLSAEDDVILTALMHKASELGLDYLSG